ncbi:MAG: GvpL/GvpF family gas vesicle protein [Thermodesulfovibrionales bacterium]|nr:GvpL/GvpF family gas vesicle protein [Thermodesulfovibrionales bacterium]
MPSKLIYLYCLTGKIPGDRVIAGIDGNVRFVSNKGLHAVASRVKADAFTKDLKENLADMRWVESNVLAHAQVVAKTMEHAAVIPFKFATLFRTEKSLKAMLDARLDEFKGLLARLEGKEEWSLKVYFGVERPGTACRDKRILKIDREIGSVSAGKAYLLRKKRQQLIEDIATEKISGWAGECLETLSRWSAETCINGLIPKEMTGRKEDMILNSAFLIDKGRLRGFMDDVDLLEEKLPWLDLNCTGPWPPYNFCSIKQEAL